MVYNGILMETIGISVMVFIVFLAGAFLLEDALLWLMELGIILFCKNSVINSTSTKSSS